MVSQNEVIAVAGGTGRVGSALIDDLLAAGAGGRVRILTRDVDKARRRFPTVASVPIDYEDRTSLHAALEGAGRLFIGLGSSQVQVQSEVALIDSAVSVRVPYLVKLSVIGGPSIRHPADWHALIESHLAAQPLGFTVLRPTNFIDALEQSAPFVKMDRWGGAAGEGRVNFMATRDVGSVAARELFDVPDEGVQRTRHLTGTRTWSMPEIAAELSKQLGREVTYHHRSPDEQLAAFHAAGVPAARAAILLGHDRTIHDGANADTTSTVERILGRAPISVESWLADHIDAFR